MGQADRSSEFRPFFTSRENLDTFNSVCWFLADAFWMMEFKFMAYGLLTPTVLSGLCLLYVEKRVPVFWINIAINSWIVMNGLWMISDLSDSPELLLYSKAAFMAGLAAVGMATLTSKSLRETFSHFRRFRALRWSKQETQFER